ncbi:14074_t:CDS:2, partial [Gigaspora margarita]
TMAEKEIINISIKLFWDDNSSATFNGPLEFTTTLNYSCTTIKNLDIPSTVLLNGKSYQRIVDKPIHSNIHNLLLPINNVSLEEANENELMLNNQILLQEQSKVSIDQYNKQFGFQDDQIKNVEMTDSSSNQYPIVLIPNANMQGSSQIDDSEDEINDNSESSEIQAEDNILFSDHQEQSDNSLPQEKDNKPLPEDKLTLLDTNDIVDVQIA